MSSNWLKTDQPCPCGESRDAYAIDAKGHGFCFNGVCTQPNRWPDGPKVEMTDKTFQVVPWRGLTRETMEFYGIRTEVEGETPVALHFSYPNGRTKIKYRDPDRVPRYQLYGEQRTNNGRLFGKDRFPAGSAQAITVTEGEMDAPSVYQMMGSKYPAVSVSSSSSAKNDCIADHDYLDSFEKIYLAFDTDEPGQKAMQEVAALFDFNKIYVVAMDPALKDANKYLQDGRAAEFSKTWWNSKRIMPEGVISSFSEFDKLIDDDGEKPSVPYPMSRLQTMTYGIRNGELVLLTAQEGIGKTEIFRYLEHHLLKTTKDKVGIIHLEESQPRMLKGLAGYELKSPAHLPDSGVTKQDIKTALRTLTGADERIHIYSHFGSDDPNVILNTIRFMVTVCGCRFIFLDHITMVVTGLLNDDERKQLDYISTKLAMMVEDHDFSCFLISHVNDDGLTRGSRNISKVADLHIHLDRDLTAPTLELRNITKLTVRKNRFAGKTGPAGMLQFDPGTFMLSEVAEMPS